MSQTDTNKFVNGLLSIAQQNPTYKNGHDGSDGSCDNIGLIRGGLMRGGATKIQNMKELNQFARKTAQDIRNVDSDIVVGNVLLKVSSEESFPLPAKYRFGGSEYNGDNRNYTDIGVLILKEPVEILHMTKDGISKDDNIYDWDYYCSLPYVTHKREGNAVKSAIIRNNGAPVKLYAKTSFSCDDFIEIPDGAMVVVNTVGTPWDGVSYGNKSGFVLSKFVSFEDTDVKLEISNEERMELEKAYMIIGKILGYIK